MKKVQALILAFAVAAALGLMLLNHSIRTVVPPINVAPHDMNPLPVQAEAPPPDVPPAPESEPPAPKRDEPRAVAKAKKTKANSGTPRKIKDPIQDPEARAALSLVGSDPNALYSWASAINNPDLPPNERKDLIEDLNEDGLSDPKHPSPEDMQIIANRIQLIESLAPTAMDDVNAAAFGEAYKDLTSMLNGQPVR